MNDIKSETVRHRPICNLPAVAGRIALRSESKPIQEPLIPIPFVTEFVLGVSVTGLCPGNGGSRREDTLLKGSDISE